jgi:hypothetical protein
MHSQLSSQENSFSNHFLAQRRGMGEKIHQERGAIEQGFMVEEGAPDEGLGRLELFGNRGDGTLGGAFAPLSVGGRFGRIR